MKDLMKKIILAGLMATLWNLYAHAGDLPDPAKKAGHTKKVKKEGVKSHAQATYAQTVEEDKANPELTTVIKIKNENSKPLNIYITNNDENRLSAMGKENFFVKILPGLEETLYLRKDGFRIMRISWLQVIGQTGKRAKPGRCDRLLVDNDWHLTFKKQRLGTKCTSEDITRLHPQYKQK